MDWIENAEIKKSNGNGAINISKENNLVEIILNEKEEKAILKINNWTPQLKVKKENSKLNIYFEPSITIELVVMIENGNLNIYDPEKDSIRSFAISSDSDFIGIGTDAAGKGVGDIYFLNGDGKLLWKKRIQDKFGGIVDSLGVSKNGDYIVAGIQSGLVHFYDKTGKELWNYDFSGYEVKTVAISQDADIIAVGIGITGGADHPGNNINALDKDGKILWAYETKDSVNHIAMSQRGEYILAGSEDSSAYLLDKQGKLLWQDDFGKPIKKVGVSPKGDKIIISDGNKVFLYIVSLPVISPDVVVAEKETISLEWGDVGADKYIVQIDNKTYETTSVKFNTPALSEGNYTWRVRPVYSDGYQGPWTKNRTISVPKVTENPVNITFQTVAVIVFVLLAIIFAIPYYKRAKLKREMAQTPTDWCPHCHKFTGGAKVCTHCGKETLASVGYDTSKKVKKKEKEGIVTPLENISIPEKVELKFDDQMPEREEKKSGKKEAEELKEESKVILYKKAGKTGESTLRKKRAVKTESSQNTVKEKKPKKLKK